MQGLSAFGMRQFKNTRVQKNPLGRAAPVQLVSQNRKPLLRKMDSYLMCAPSK